MLSEKEKKVYMLVKAGLALVDVASEVNLAPSSVKTYFAKAKKFYAKHKEKQEIRRCSSFYEFSQMMKKIEVVGTSLKERVEEFKTVYCQACTHPSRCDVCPTKVLIEKYLF